MTAVDLSGRRVRPERGRAIIFALIVVVPVSYMAREFLGERLTQPIYGTLALLAFHAVVGHAREVSKRRTLLLYLTFFAILVLATAAARISGLGGEAEDLLALVLTFLWTSPFVALAIVMRTEAHVRLALRLFRAVGLLVSASVYASAGAYSAFGYRFGEIVDVFGQYRAFGPLGDQVGFAIAIFAGMALGDRRWAAFVAHFGAVLLTGTRGAVVAVLVGVLVLLLVRHTGGTRRRVRVLSGLMLLATAAVFTPIGQVAVTQLTEESRGSALAARSAPFAVGIEVARQNPLLGSGFLGFQGQAFATGAVAGLSAGTDLDRATYTSQNQYLQTLNDGGIVALAALLALLARLTHQVSKARRSGALFSAELLTIQVGLTVMILGNQSAVWILPSAAAGYFFFVLAAVGVRAAELSSVAVPTELAPSPRAQGSRRRS